MGPRHGGKFDPGGQARIDRPRARQAGAEALEVRVRRTVVTRCRQTPWPPSDPMRVTAPERRLPPGALRLETHANRVGILVARDDECGRGHVPAAVAVV